MEFNNVIRQPDFNTVDEDEKKSRIGDLIYPYIERATN